MDAKAGSRGSVLGAALTGLSQARLRTAHRFPPDAVAVAVALAAAIKVTGALVVICFADAVALATTMQMIVDIATTTVLFLLL